MSMEPQPQLLKIGLIGGLSFPSTITYYDRINRLANARLGKAHSPRIVVESLDFQPIAQALSAGDDSYVIDALVSSACRLAGAGADFVAICCNTVHKYADVIEERIPLPLLNICRATAAEASSRGARVVGLLGSAFSMEESFYRREFEKQGMRVIVPELDDRRFIQHSIETELSIGEVSTATRQRLLRCAHDLLNRGADVLVLACTELPLVLRPQDIDAPLLDTVEVHSAAIVALAAADRSTSDSVAGDAFANHPRRGQCTQPI